MEIVSSPQANAYDGVKYVVSQKDTALRGEALRQPDPYRGRDCIPRTLQMIVAKLK
jgi:hypothetical protein